MMAPSSAAGGRTQGRAGPHRCRASRGIALLIESSNAYAREILHGIRAYNREHGPWAIRFSELGRSASPPRWLRHWHGDGIIARIHSHRLAREVEALGVPTVDTGASGIAPTMPCVEPDHEGIARLAAEHLLERGFTHFGFYGLAGLRWSVLRGAHFRRLVSEAGHDCDVYEQVTARDWPDPWQVDSARAGRWIARLAKPAGILAAWDGCAMQALQVCHDLGIAVPDEVAVLGVDNDELLCDLADPSLSSVVTTPQQVGYRAAELLDRVMGGGGVPDGSCLVRPLGIATRRSTDILAIEDPHVGAAIRYIRAQACRGINVNDVLRATPLSRRSLEERFRKALGRTPHEEIARVQLRRVRELLTGTNLPLAEVATRTGFNHVEYMSVAFKRAEGIPPGEYRVRNRARP